MAFTFLFFSFLSFPYLFFSFLDVRQLVQEISDDLGRHRSDAQINNSCVTVLRGHEEVLSEWKHLQPGDLVKVCLPHPSRHLGRCRPSHGTSACACSQSSYTLLLHAMSKHCCKAFVPSTVLNVSKYTWPPASVQFIANKTLWS